MFAKNIKKEEKNKKSNSFTRLDLLTKLRVVIYSVFVLSTIAIILLIVNSWAIGASLAIISYLMVLVLTIKLLIIKKL